MLTEKHSCNKSSQIRTMDGSEWEASLSRAGVAMHPGVVKHLACCAY